MKLESDAQSEMFDSDGTEPAKSSAKRTLLRPEKHNPKDTKNKHFAFGWQDEFNLLGHIVDVFDQLPLYSVERRVEATNGSFEPITMSAEIVQSKTMSFSYKLTITPNARFAQHVEVLESGKTKISYEPILHDFKEHPNAVVFRPGPREDSVEKAIRRIARRLTTSNPKSPVYKAGFTLYQLKKELQRSGHSIRWDDLRESLHILSNTGITLTLTTPDGKEINYKTDFISGLSTGSRVKSAKHFNPAQDRCYCTLNDIVAYSLRTERYQALQHDLYMRMSSFLARRILATISIEWRNAHTQTGYERSMNDLILRYNDSLSDRLNDDMRLTKKAMDELVAKEILSRYEMHKVVTGTKRAGKDFRVIMFPTSRFVGTQIEAIRDRTIRTERNELGQPSYQLELGDE